MVLVFIALTLLSIPVLSLYTIETQSVYTEVLRDNITVYVEPKRNVVVVDSVFTVNVSIANVPQDGLHSYQFELTYNNTVLEGISVTLPEGHFLTPENPDHIFVAECRVIQIEGSVRVAVTFIAPEPEKVGNGTLVTITFKAKSPGNSTLSIPYPILVPPSSHRYENVDVVEGFVEVVSPDLNMDGRVDLTDLNLQKEAFRSHPGHPNWDPIADLNKDNWVNILDLSMVAKDYGKTVQLTTS